MRHLILLLQTERVMLRTFSYDLIRANKKDGRGGVIACSLRLLLNGTREVRPADRWRGWATCKGQCTRGWTTSHHHRQGLMACRGLACYTNYRITSTLKRSVFFSMRLKTVCFSIVLVSTILLVVILNMNEWKCSEVRAIDRHRFKHLKLTGIRRILVLISYIKQALDSSYFYQRKWN